MAKQYKFYKINIAEKDKKMQNPNQLVSKEQKPKAPIAKSTKVISTISSQYTESQNLSKAIEVLPSNYNFEIQKTLARIEGMSKEMGKKNLRISLQFPEGLMLYACLIADILKVFSAQINNIEIEVVIMGDVTYGACCVDDIASDKMECDLLVHYGHSCLVPITETRRKILYVFVQIQIDIKHFIETVVFNFKDLKDSTIFLMSTIQFNNSLFLTKQYLVEEGFSKIIIPQEKPRSGGEVLGCTSPRLPPAENGERSIVIFLCDGRFHMEATMIANPQFEFYQYDPYSRNMTEEKYATDLMIQRREEEIQKAAAGPNKSLCFILGTLGRQGNPEVLDRLIKKIENKYDYMILLASEVNTELLNLVPVDFYVQIACPRLSIDWAYGVPKPMLTSYELYVLIDQINIKQHYSMDFYSNNGGPWSNFYGKNSTAKSKKVVKTKPKVQLKFE